MCLSIPSLLSLKKGHFLSRHYLSLARCCLNMRSLSVWGGLSLCLSLSVSLSLYDFSLELFFSITTSLLLLHLMHIHVIREEEQSSASTTQAVYLCVYFQNTIQGCSLCRYTFLFVHVVVLLQVKPDVVRNSVEGLSFLFTAGRTQCIGNSRNHEKCWRIKETN